MRWRRIGRGTIEEMASARWCTPSILRCTCGRISHRISLQRTLKSRYAARTEDLLTHVGDKTGGEATGKLFAQNSSKSLSS